MGGGEFGIKAAGPAALFGDDHADPEPPDGGEVLFEREGAAAGDDPLFGDSCRPAGGQRLRGVEDANGEGDAGPVGGLRVGGEVPRAGRDQDGAAVGEGEGRGLLVVGGELDGASRGLSSGRRKTRQGMPRRFAAFCAAAWAAAA